MPEASLGLDLAAVATALSPSSTAERIARLQQLDDALAHKCTHLRPLASRPSRC